MIHGQKATRYVICVERDCPYVDAPRFRMPPAPGDADAVCDNSIMMSQASDVLKTAEAQGMPVYLYVDRAAARGNSGEIYDDDDDDGGTATKMYTLRCGSIPPPDRPSVVASPGDAPAVVAGRLGRLADYAKKNLARQDLRGS